jgi:predicted RNA-binding protein with PIN domain
LNAGAAPGIPARQLRQAIEAALRVARQGEEADPIEPAPPALRRYVSFARLPAPALDAARRVIDDDDEFRSRVADAVTADEVGEAGWLWLNRPPGWEERLGEVVGRAERRREDASAARDERSLRRKIDELEEALRRLDVAAAGDRQQALALRAEVDAERSRRRAAARVAEEHQAGRSAAEANLERATAELAQLAGELAQLAGEQARVTDERDLALARVAELEHQLTQLARADRTRPAENPASDVGGAEPFAAGDGVPEAVVPAAPEVDREALTRTIAAASAALAEASALLEGAPAGSRPPSIGIPAADEVRPALRRPPTRQRVKLPGGVLDDGVEAAEHLVRVPNALLLVDGYNISNALAPGQTLKEQRSRLVDALSELQARTGTAVEVVFDGAPGPDTWITGGRPPVHVQFSPPGVEADDVLVERIASLPATRPVILATSDRDLRDRARRHGANLLGARQLLAVMRR